MRNLSLIILTSSILICSCSRKSVPQESVNIKDSVRIKDSVVVRDSTVIIPGSEIQFKDEISFIRENQDSSKTDTTHYIRSIEKDHLTASVDIDRKGRINVSCKADSLKKRIEWLEHQVYSFHERETVRRVPVPGPVVEKAIIPGWMKWYLLFSLLYILWNFRYQIMSLFGGVFTIIKRLIGSHG